MKYVALLSGGKDSCYNLLHCSRNGHQLIAAASLCPEHGKEELDSYLYQTVGQDVIEFVARALDVPLYRQVISGAAIEQGSEYGGRRAEDSGGVLGDETEDLYSLLSTVKTAHPDIEGVSVGAILSNYQRVRIEHVCRRLALTPLSYLWQRDQAELLSEMIEAGMEAVLIKVAGIGLTVKHLGKTLAEMRTTLTKLSDLYGLHICGEGGEYETLTLDCPLFKRRIRLTEVETVIHSHSDFAVVAYLRIKKAVLEPKSINVSAEPTIPPLLTDEFKRIEQTASESLSVASADVSLDIGSTPLFAPEPTDSSSCSNKMGSWVAITNITATATSPDFSIEEEVRSCFQQLRDHLNRYSLQLSNCTIINVFLSSMDLFTRVNAVYATFFGTSPPVRACVAVDLSPPTRVKLDCIAYAESKPFDRQALHVQGLSYWAPANIGPYSQAIVVDERIFISGQIGLVPSSLTLPSPPSLALETALSFQHVARIVGALKNNSGGGWQGHEQGVLYWLADKKDVPHVKRASQSYSKDACAPTLFLVISALPKGALVEKQVLLHTGQRILPDDDGDEVLRSLTPNFKQGDLVADDGACVHWEASTLEETTSSMALICFRGDVLGDIPLLQNYSDIKVVLSGALSIRLFYRPSRASSFREKYHQLFQHSNHPPVTCIPCRYISTKSRDDWDYAMVIIGS